LRQAISLLREHYGKPPRPPSRDPFELILLENVAYLASDEKRKAAFEKLASTVGTRPEEILGASAARLRAVTSHGILSDKFAEKLVACARIALVEFEGDLTPVMRLPLKKARTALRRFPGIGEPGAEKILLFSDRQKLLAPESNGLRVLVRVGAVREAGSYAATYAAARDVAAKLMMSGPKFLVAHLLLRRHGNELCRRKDPLCDRCPLAKICRHHAEGGEREPAT
jgi:endonuclease-3